MPTNPIPPGSRNLSVNVPDSLHAELKRLAKESNMTISRYVRQVLSLACQQNLVVKTHYVVEDGQQPLKVVEESD